MILHSARVQDMEVLQRQNEGCMKKLYGNPEPSNPQAKGVLGNVAQF